MNKILLFSICACLPFGVSAKKIKEELSTINKIKNKSEIVVAVREYQFPFSYLDEKGNARGYTVEVCENLIKNIRKELDIPRLKIIYFPVKEEDTQILFRKGILDLDCGNAHTNNKKSDVISYSNGFLGVEARILTSYTNNVQSLSDFNNQVVAVLKGSTLEGLLSRYISNGTYFYRLKTVNSLNEGIQSLENGNSKAYIDDDVVLLSVLNQNKNLRKSFNITGSPITSKEYGFALKSNDFEFEKLINKDLKKLLDDGKIHQVYEKWFLKSIPPENINLDFGMSKSTRNLLTKMQ